MKSYLNVTLVEAMPMKLGAYNEYRGWVMPKDEDPDTNGYLVKYSSGYETWCPKYEFERKAFELSSECGTKITDPDVAKFMGKTEASKFDEKTTIVKAETLTGFRQIETSSCVNPDNFDMKIGSEICVDRISNEMYKLLGFVLQWAMYGLTYEK